MSAQSRKLLQRLWIEPPVFFPVAVVFHFFLVVLNIVQLGDSDSIATYWPNILWSIGGLILSIFCLLMQRWAAIGYMLLTATGLVLAYALPVSIFYKNLGATLLPFDAIFSAILLFFFKRFR